MNERMAMKIQKQSAFRVSKTRKVIHMRKAPIFANVWMMLHVPASADANANTNVNADGDADVEMK
ncbi:hypothetical protein BPOR_2137g00010 [Botrytis porri]|uniref:Uncharacterized protein n=1 Tax=Botrytis porri TaxID=87229 RepID=A0A4Z1JXT9_9HELO|nr:hypothetical protein BPOR_2137g00010 [Botrytis porri]